MLKLFQSQPKATPSTTEPSLSETVDALIADVQALDERLRRMETRLCALIVALGHEEILRQKPEK